MKVIPYHILYDILTENKPTEGNAHQYTPTTPIREVKQQYQPLNINIVMRRYTIYPFNHTVEGHSKPTTTFHIIRCCCNGKNHIIPPDNKPTRLQLPITSE